MFFSGSAEQSMVFTVFTGSVELAFRSHCDFEGLVEQSVVLSSKAWYLLCLPRLSRAVFRSHCDFEGLVEQSVVFIVFSRAQLSWLFEVTAVLKA